MKSFSQATELAMGHGRRRHARWRPDLFRSAIDGPVLRVWSAIGEATDREARFDAYLDLVVEAIGRGHLDDTLLAEPKRGGVLPTLLVDRIPRLAATLDASRLVDLWNVGEGLQGHAPWLDRLLAPAVASLESLDDFEAFIADALRQVHAEDVTILPKGFLGTQIVDLRSHVASFVPGTLRFVTPRVLAVHDRRRDEELAVAVLESDVWVAGPLELPPKGPPPSEVSIALSPQQLRIGETRAYFGGLTTWQHVVVSPAGFVAATCVDSQRLWIGRVV